MQTSRLRKNLLLLGTLTLLSSPSLALAADAKAPEDAKRIVLRFQRYGGFAGFHDDLSIFADYSYTLGTPRHIKHVYAGNLTAEHRTAIAELLGRCGKIATGHDDGPGIADGMRQSLQINGSGNATKLTRDENSKLQGLLHQIMTTARKQDPVPK